MTGKRKLKTSIVIEVAIVFLLCTIATGIEVYFCVDFLFTKNIDLQTERRATELSKEVELTITDYESYPWLIEYWYTHADTMDIEYDAVLDKGCRTAKKWQEFSQRHPDLQLMFMDEEDCEALTEKDQKLYAEIVYSVLLTRLDQIKESFGVEHIYSVVTEEPFRQMFFLLSAAEPGADRGSEPDQAYTLGTTVHTNIVVAEALREGAENHSYLTFTGDNADIYKELYTFGEHTVLVGVAFERSEMRHDIRTHTRIGAAIAILNQIALSVICLILLSILLLRPLKRIQKSIRSYSETKDSEAARREMSKIRSHNELGQVADDMVDLAKEMDAYTDQIRSITSERERIATELDLASKIQAAAMPNISRICPERSEFKIAGSMDPAKEVGGDFYDYFLIDEDHLCMVIADVSDKGVPAALFMMASKITLSQNAKAGKSPAKILADANKAISNNNPMQQFVTVWIGILQISTGRLTSANAGHEYPVIKTPEGSFELVEDEHDFVVGFMDGIEYNEYEMLLQPGTTLFLYTDGLPEAIDAGEQPFGMERMLKVLNEGSDLAPEQLLGHVRSAVDEFVKDAEQFDDLTMLCLEYKKEDISNEH